MNNINSAFQRFALMTRIQLSSSSMLDNFGTTIVTFLAAPILNVVFLVSFAAVLGTSDLVIAAYAAIVVNSVASMIGAMAGSVTTDRNLGLVQEVLGRRLFSPSQWVARALVPAGATLISSVVSSAVVWGMDSHHSTVLFLMSLLISICALVIGILIGIFCSLLALALHDPYMVSNIVSQLLPITAGVVAPLAAYPAWARAICCFLPGSGLVEALRDWSANGVVSSAWPLALLQDFVIALILAAIGFVIARHILSAIRKGRLSAAAF